MVMMSFLERMGTTNFMVITVPEKVLKMVMIFYGEVLETISFLAEEVMIF